MKMSSRFRSFLYGTSFFKEHRDLAEDRGKLPMMAPGIFITVVNLWPEKMTPFMKAYSVMMIAIEALHTASLFVFLALNARDMTTFTEILSSSASSIQSVTKGTLLYYKSKDLKKLIEIVRYEFLPSNVVDQETENNIAEFSSSVLNRIFAEYVVAFLSRVLCAVTPVLVSTQILPFNSWFPFDSSKSPAYEIIYAIQSWIAIYVDVNVIVGYDSLYCTICSNCVVQFQLLHAAIKKIGTGEEKEVAARLLEVPGVSYEPVFDKRDEDERRLLVLCIKHHQKLIYVCNELNTVFGDGHFFQFVITLFGICPTCYLISKGTHSSNLSMLLAYYGAHLCQLFLYCSVSNELSLLGVSISDAAYESLWYKKEYKDLRKSLLIVMMRSQMVISMNAFGLFILNYISFISIIRFSFSLYTFLSKMAD